MVLRGLVEKGILRHSGKRPPSECTICFTSCMLSSPCDVSPRVFQKGRAFEVLVGSQTRLGQYLIFHHQWSVSTCEMTCILFYCPLCLVESNYRAPSPFLTEKGVVSILMACEIEVDILFPVDQVLGRSCLISLGTIFFVSESKQHILATLWLFQRFWCLVSGMVLTWHSNSA